MAKRDFKISRWVVTGCANLLSNRTQKMTLVCGKMRSSILDVWSLRGPTSAEDIGRHEPKTRERSEAKPREGIKSENWSKKRERMKEL